MWAHQFSSSVSVNHLSSHNFDIWPTKPHFVALWQWVDTLYFVNEWFELLHPSLAHFLSSLCIIWLQGNQHDNTTKQNEFWTWKCHISMTNRTPESNEVSLESSGILTICWESTTPNKWASGTLQGETTLPWQHNKTKTNFELESAISPWTVGPQSQNIHVYVY
jgi:hypothetical protein